MADFNSIPSSVMSDGGSGTPLEDEAGEAASLERMTPTIDEIPESEALSDSKQRGESATPTQDEAEPLHAEAQDLDGGAAHRLTAELISSLAPGVSASGAEAMEAALEGIPAPVELHQEEGGAEEQQREGGVDDVSDNEFAEEDLGDLALQPVSSNQTPKDGEDRAEASSRLSNISSISVGSLKDGKEDDISLSGFSSDDAPEAGKLQIRSDAEDGEIMGPKKRPSAVDVPTAAATSETRDADNSRNRNGRLSRGSRSSSSSSSDDDRSERNKKRRLRKRSDSSHKENVGSPRPSSRGASQKKKKELPRYDVRNVINRKRAKRASGAKNKSRRSRSSSRSSSSRSRSRSRSASPRGRKKSFRSRSRSPVRRGGFGSRSRSRSRSLRRRLGSRSPPRRGFRSRSRSPVVGKRFGSRSRSPIGRGGGRKGRSPSSSRSRSRNRNNKRSKRRNNTSRSWSRSRSRSVSPVSPPSKRTANKQGGGGGKKKGRNKKRGRDRLRSPSPLEARPTSRSKGRNKSPPPSSSKKNKKNKRQVSPVNDTNTTGRKVGKKNKDKGSKKSKKSKRSSGGATGGRNEISLVNTHTSSSYVRDKEVYASGDKIMVSVNFKNNSAKEIAAAKKPSVVIDIMESPYRVIENSPEAVVDIFTDDEGNDVLEVVKSKSADKSLERGDANQKKDSSLDDSGGSKLLDQSTNSDMIAVGDQPSMVQHKGPCTPPPVDNCLDLARGPQTPEEDSYDPCNPTESPTDTNLEPRTESSASAKDASSNAGGQGQNSLLKTAASTIPFLMDDSLVQRLEGQANNNKGGGNQDTSLNSNGNDINDLPVDMDMDSPYSPHSSDMEDMFDPPVATPSKKKQKGIFGSSGSHSKANGVAKSHHGKSGKSGKHSKHIHTRVIDDRLKIIDDVPNSAVEMVIKDKFLKKVQRQERIVEEIKTVLKPYYCRKKISKEDYKDILRKCVPKVCHSKNGDINPTKIQKLVKGYVRKYHYVRKKAPN